MTTNFPTIKLIFFLLAASIASAAIAQAADSLMRMDDVHQAFNSAAKQVDSEARMVLISCKTGKIKICQYRLSGNIGALVVSADDKPHDAEIVTFVFAKDSNPKIWVEIIGLSMLAFSPSSDGPERKQAMVSLARGINKRRDNQVILSGVQYELRAPQHLGIFLNIQKI